MSEEKTNYVVTASSDATHPQERETLAEIEQLRQQVTLLKSQLASYQDLVAGIKLFLRGATGP